MSLTVCANNFVREQARARAEKACSRAASTTMVGSDRTVLVASADHIIWEWCSDYLQRRLICVPLSVDKKNGTSNLAISLLLFSSRRRENSRRPPIILRLTSLESACVERMYSVDFHAYRSSTSRDILCQRWLQRCVSAAGGLSLNVIADNRLSVVAGN